MSELRAQSAAGGRRDPGTGGGPPADDGSLRARAARRNRPETIPNHSAAMVRLFAEINRSAAPMLGLVALGLGAVALAWIGVGALATWSAFIVCAIALIYVLPIAFLDGVDSEKAAGAWRRKFVAGDRLLRRRLGLSRPRRCCSRPSRARRPLPFWSCCSFRP